MGRSRRTSLLLSLLVSLPIGLLARSAGAHVPGADVGAFGSAVVDGVRSPNEWDRAAVIDYGQYAFYVMNDDRNLYVAMRVDMPTLQFSSFGIEFDNDHDGVFYEPGDDSLVFITTLGFLDEFRTADNVLPDTDQRGSNDGAGAAANDGQSSFYEMSHPLNSGDLGHDVALRPGDTVGFIAVATICDSGCTDLWAPIESTGGYPPGGDIRIFANPNAPPAAVATPSTLWPPNHNLVPVSVSIALPGPWAGSAVELIAVTSSDPGGTGCGEPDIQDAAIGTDDRTVLLRAEREGGRTRTYTLSYRLTVPSGESTVVDATVVVRDPRGGF